MAHLETLLETPIYNIIVTGEFCCTLIHTIFFLRVPLRCMCVSKADLKDAFFIAFFGAVFIFNSLPGVKAK